MVTNLMMSAKMVILGLLKFYFIFFYLGFLLRTFTNHRTAEEGGEYFFNSSLPLPPASQTLKHSGTLK